MHEEQGYWGTHHSTTHTLSIPQQQQAPPPPSSGSRNLDQTFTYDRNPITTTTNCYDTSLDASSVPPMTNSTSSSCAESWGSGNLEPDESHLDTHLEQEQDNILAIPKLEPVDDELDLDDLKAASSAPENLSVSQTKHKRPRGRPRKHPVTTMSSTNKVTKGRSKTGCITCRKRKKKCDEAKPRCTFPSELLFPCPRLDHTSTRQLIYWVYRHELREECCSMRRLSRETGLEKWKGKG